VDVSCTQFRKEHAGLAFKFQVNPDSCANPEHYENYIRFVALTDWKLGKGVTYILIDDTDDNQAIIGFITLRASSYISTNGEIIGRAAIEITEIAIDKMYEKQGYGTALLDMATLLIDELRNTCIGVEYIIACADPASVPFYEKNDFYQVLEYYDIPREGWNNNCIPMALKLPEL